MSLNTWNLLLCCQLSRLSNLLFIPMLLLVTAKNSLHCIIMYSINMYGIHGHTFCMLTDLNAAFCILGIRAGEGQQQRQNSCKFWAGQITVLVSLL